MDLCKTVNSPWPQDGVDPLRSQVQVSIPCDPRSSARAFGAHAEHEFLLSAVDAFRALCANPKVPAVLPA
ncbi:hypothetical protein SBA4_2620006 [Candidatus Sulfopaludibacter sp. SbA4]|nr:hypothetical protein SBA4_2620006 [Candidatus Sulfopaludibacter sp. SbA4]